MVRAYNTKAWRETHNVSLTIPSRLKPCSHVVLLQGVKLKGENCWLLVQGWAGERLATKSKHDLSDRYRTLKCQLEEDDQNSRMSENVGSMDWWSLGLYKMVTFWRMRTYWCTLKWPTCFLDNNNNLLAGWRFLSIVPIPIESELKLQ